MSTTIEPATAVEIIRAITAGGVDDQLDAVIEAIRQRRNYLTSVKVTENLAMLSPGTQVEIFGRISPKYLVGQRGVVLDKQASRRGDIMIGFPSEILFRRSLISELGIPANCLRAVAR